MMHSLQRRSRASTDCSILLVCAALLMSGAAHGDSAVPGSFDNQGGKVFAALQKVPQPYLEAGSSDRTLARFYALRQYPGSPPAIPHRVDLSFSGNETDCLACHATGGYSAEFDAWAPVTPHPEHTLCFQCHAPVAEGKLFVDSTWESV